MSDDRETFIPSDGKKQPMLIPEWLVKAHRNALADYMGWDWLKDNYDDTEDDE